MPKKNREQGQALLEFLLLLGIVFILSLTILKVTSSRLSRNWKILIDTVAYPSKVQFR